MDSGRLLMLICLLGFLLWVAKARTIETRLLKSKHKKGTSKGETPTGTPSPASALRDASGPPPGDDSKGTVFDVTKYGAIGDGKTNNNKAFLNAWAAACKSTEPSSLLVPKGDYFLTSIMFSGPCGNKKSPRVEISGKLIAPTSYGSTESWITFDSLNELDITGSGTGSLDGQGEASWGSSCDHNSNSNCKMAESTLRLFKITGGSLSGITLINSKAFHIGIVESSDFTVHDINIQAPATSRNTDGVHIGDSSGITVTNSNIGTGDDCVSVGDGTSNILVSNVNCGPGHGISLGSLGRYQNEKEVNGITVKSCTFTGTDNGVRIKTWPASEDNKVSNVIFEDLIMKNVKNPIIINQEYCDKNQCDSSPSRVKLTDILFKNIKGTSATKEAVALICSQAVPCEGVQLVDIDLTSSDGDSTSVCENAKGLPRAFKCQVRVFESIQF